MLDSNTDVMFDSTLNGCSSLFISHVQKKTNQSTAVYKTDKCQLSRDAADVAQFIAYAKECQKEHKN